MSQGQKTQEQEEELRPEYDFDFKKSEQGKYFDRYTQSSNVVVLDNDVAASFPNAAAVNLALRTLLQFASQTASLIASSTETPKDFDR